VWVNPPPLLFFSHCSKKKTQKKGGEDARKMGQRSRDHFHLTRAKAHLMNRDVDRAMRHLDKCGFGGDEGAGIPSEDHRKSLLSGRAICGG
jgi:hypothetical protein